VDGADDQYIEVAGGGGGSVLLENSRGVVNEPSVFEFDNTNYIARLKDGVTEYYIHGNTYTVARMVYWKSSDIDGNADKIVGLTDKDYIIKLNEFLSFQTTFSFSSYI